VFETRVRGTPPVVENRPDAAYVPTHVEGMETLGVTDVGEMKVGITYSFPHRFWVVENEGGEYVTTKVEVRQDDAVHLMAVPWDPETDVVLPNAGLAVEITRDGGLVSEEVIYPMLSQRMGPHYGANVPLPGDGTYEVRVSVGGVDVAKFGSFEGRFASAASNTLEFEFSERALNDVTYRMLPEKQGQRGAVRPMEMEAIPTGDAPTSLPGTSLGRGTSGDVVFLGSVVDAERFGSRPYLAVSPRTPHNGLAVPGMALSATVGGSKSVELVPGLDPGLGFHYGASVSGVSADQSVEVSVDIPPQVARHEGYETAFLDMPSFAFE
jgi:hypothetical protein